jgi:hypothetical protein
MPFVKRDSLLLHDQKVDFDTQEQKPDFPLVTQNWSFTSTLPLRRRESALRLRRSST